MIEVYTKDKCFYCVMLKEKLDEWGIQYSVVNNEPLPDDSKTYPQLYYKGKNIQRGSSTDLTLNMIEERVERIDWPGIDGGIE